jgi:hypothetical protein
VRTLSLSLSLLRLGLFPIALQLVFLPLFLLGAARMFFAPLLLLVPPLLSTRCLARLLALAPFESTLHIQPNRRVIGIRNDAVHFEVFRVPKLVSIEENLPKVRSQFLLLGVFIKKKGFKESLNPRGMNSIFTFKTISGIFKATRDLP